MVLDSFNGEIPLNGLSARVTVINTKLEHGVKICHVNYLQLQPISPVV